MRRLLAVAVIAGMAITTQGFAQGRTAVTGNVKDNTGKGIASVSIALLQAKDSSLVKADVSDANGHFDIAGKAGKFLLSYSMVGFEKKFSPVFELQAGQSYNAGDATLEAAAKKLQDVTVTSKKPMIEIKADKTIFNVESSINATGSNALELL